MKELKNKYVTDENKYRENDIIYEIKIKNETLYFYILLEFQSTVDKKEIPTGTCHAILKAAGIKK